MQLWRHDTTNSDWEPHQGSAKGRDWKLTQGEHLIWILERKKTSCFQKPQIWFAITTTFYSSMLFNSFAMPHLMLLVNLSVDLAMASTRKGKEENKKLLQQLSESDTDFKIRQNNHEAKTEYRNNTVEQIVTLKNENNRARNINSQEDILAIEESNLSSMRNEVGSLMTMVETRVQEAFLTAIEKSVFPWVRTSNEVSQCVFCTRRG